jgi:hypothetical protein
MLTMACHCTGCQHMTGGPYSLSAMVASDNFELLSGDPVVGGLKGGEIDHMVCPDCMSWVFTKVMDGAFINLRSPMLDDTTGTAPFIESYTSEKLDWVTTPAQHSFGKFPEMDEYLKLISAFAEQGPYGRQELSD